MKKAPDKIWVTPVRTWDTKPIPDLIDNIYISKDALLEWAEAKHMELDPPQNERDFGRIEAVEELIDKINSL